MKKYCTFISRIFLIFSLIVVSSEAISQSVTINSSTAPSCDGVCDGEVTFTIAGPSPLYALRISSSCYTKDTFNLASPGTYTIGGLCQCGQLISLQLKNNANINTSVSPVTTTSMVAPAPISLSQPATTTTPKCPGDSTGTINISLFDVQGGNGGYSFLWNNGNTSLSLGNLPASNYTLTISDIKNCTNIFTVPITDPAPLLANFDTLSIISCFGLCNGSAEINPTGGTGNKTFLWANTIQSNNVTNSLTDSIITGLCAGVYYVTITDDSACVSTDSITFVQPSDFAISKDSTNVSCGGLSDAMAEVIVSGATPPYSYLWSNADTTSQITGIPAGNYNVTITDSLLCSKIISFTITQPDTVKSNLSFTHVLCFDSADGTALSTPLGGTAPFSYQWSTGVNDTLSSISNLAPGVYLITVTDNNNCEDIDSVTITQPTIVVPNASVVNVTCFGAGDGIALATPSGGTSPYTFSWSSVSNNDSIFNLTPNTYFVTVTDANSCNQLDTVEITQPTVLQLGLTNTPVSCFGLTDGAASVSPSGGTGTIDVLWSTTATTSSIGPLAPATYGVTITDDNNCTLSQTFGITEPSKVTAVALGQDVTCFDVCNGSATATATGGDGTYTFAWSNGNIGTNATALCDTAYIVTATDGNGCTGLDTVTINQPTQIISNISNVDVTCKSAADGIALINPTGGANSYSFVWSLGASTNDSIFPLAPDTYFVSITDTLFCTVIDSIVVDEPDTLLSPFSNVQPTCFGGTNGSITAAPIGGTAPYHYVWSTSLNDTLISLSNIGAGIYTVTITDANGCTFIGSDTLTQPTQVGGTGSFLASTCSGICNGIAIISGSGGNPIPTIGYTYLWNDVAATTNDSLNAVCAGTYVVTVTDNNGCSNAVNVQVQNAIVVTATTTITTISCSGSCNAAAFTAASGGAQPYSYNWSTGLANSTDSAQTNLCPITYFISVTDNQGCQIIDTVNIGLSSNPLITDSVTDVTCFGANNGEAFAAVTGGVAPYSFIWSNSSINDTLINLSPGTYTLTVTDFNACADTMAFVVNEPTALFANTSTIDVSCFGLFDGSVISAPTGGNGGYQFNWVTTCTLDTCAGLNAGTYLVTVTDSKGCQVIDSAIVTQPQVLSATVVDTIPSCFGVCDGSAKVNVLGGTTPYQFNWNIGGGNNNYFANLCANSYAVTISDANGCLDTVTFILNQPNALVVSGNATNVTCFGAADGILNATAVGGTPAYTFNWQGIGIGQSFSNVSPGSYIVTVTDLNGCSDTNLVSIVQPTQLSLNPITTAASCSGDCNNTIDANPVGGNTTFTYTWSATPATNLSTPTPTTQALAGLCPGTYRVTATDNKGCTASDTIIINDGAAITATQTTIEGVCNTSSGTISLTASGGTSPYFHSWSTGDTATAITSTLNNLAAGIYRDTITDANGCQYIHVVNLGNAGGITGEIVSISNANCYNSADGEIAVSPIGGAAPIQFLWNNPTASTTQNITGLSSGTYVLQMTDANNCLRFVTADVLAPDSIDPVLNVSDISCFGLIDGSITANPSGGVSPYQYSWSNGSALPFVSNLSAGNYTLTITDLNACVFTYTSAITEPTAVVATAVVTNPTCYETSNGTIAATVTGGNAPYAFDWSNGSTAATASALSPGIYILTVTDNNFCSTVLFDTISAPDSLVLTPLITTATCGQANGAITTSITNGTAPFNYFWGSGITTPNRSNISAGIYSVTVTDANNCNNKFKIGVNSTNGPIIGLSNFSNASCNGSNDGSASITVSGTNPFTYLWQPTNATTASISNLASGVYVVQVTDGLGCISIDSVEIGENNSISLNSTVNNVSCSSGADGDILITPSNGIVPYTYAWSNASTAQFINGLSIGTYTVTVTDALGCEETESITIEQPAALSVVADGTNLSCFESADGTVTAVVSGGTGPYVYSWSNGSNNESITALPVGNYSVTVTDANFCSAVATQTLVQPTAVEATTTISNSPCNAASGSILITPSGGSGTGYGYSWSHNVSLNSALAANLAAGTYIVTITDGDGCSTTLSENINNTNGPTATLTSQDVTCFSANDGAASVVASSPTSTVSILWTPGNSTSFNLTGLSAGSYSGFVADTNGCFTVVSADITEPNQILASTAVTSIKCFGDNTGKVVATAIGGLGPLSLNWSTSAVGDSIVNISAGLYSLTVTDSVGCSITTSAIVTQPTQLNFALSASQINCFGINDGSVTASVSGGTPTYTYAWSNGGSGSSIIGLSDGNYGLTVTDNGGCTVSGSESLIMPTLLSTLQSATNLVCAGFNTGAATVIPSGGTTPYAYVWNIPGATSSTVSNIAAGSYTVITTDNNGCQEFDTIPVTSPDSLVLDSVVSIGATCGSCNGSMQVFVSGGTGTYNYLWDAAAGSQTSQNATALCAGPKAVTVTDANSCTGTFNSILNNSNGPGINFNITNVSCASDSSGAVKAIATGNGPFTFNWISPIVSSIDSLINIPAGDYVLQLTDVNGCITADTATILGNSAITLTLTSTPVTCRNDCDASIIAVATGAGAPFAFNWSNGVANDTLLNLCPGVYTLTITDINGCIKVDSVTIANPDTFIVNSTSTPTTCFNTCTGTANAAISGGVTPYTINWGGGQTSAAISAVCAGPANVTVTDANNCVRTSTATVAAPSAITIVLSKTDASCGLNNGEAIATVSGGTPFTASQSYAYAWSGSASATETASNIVAGNQLVTVTDSIGCSATDSITIINFGSPTITINTVTPLTCNSVCDGSIDIDVTGGATPYQYLWSNGEITQDLSLLCSNNYSVTVTDANNCVVSDVAVVTAPAAINIGFVTISPTCGAIPCNGAVTASVSGGTAPLAIEWFNGSSLATVSGLCSGIYNITITDGVGCVDSASATLNDLGGPTGINATITDVACNSDSTGAASVAVIGGTTPYQFNWIGTSSTTNSISNVPADNYTVQITDANNCLASFPVAIAEPSALLATVGSIDAQCGIADGLAFVAASGGSQPYAYTWNTTPSSTNDNISNLFFGSYIVTITDNNNCALVDTAFVNNFGAVSITVQSTTEPKCNGDANGAINITPSGGQLPYLFNWAGPSNFVATTEDISALAAGNYIITITDNLNCATVQSFVLNQPQVLQAGLSVIDATCSGANGQVSAAFNGGTAPYAFTWSTAATNDTLFNVSASNYFITLTDANLCQALDTAVVLNQAGPTGIIFNVADVVCFGDTTGSVKANVLGGTAPYTYTWGTGAVADSIFFLATGNYPITVTDFNGCSISDIATVNSNSQITATFTTVSPTCGFSDGSATVIPSGGSGNYSFVWGINTGSQTTQTAVNLGPGSYSVTVVDISGCSNVFTVNLSNLNGPVVTIDSIVDVTCFGSCNGKAFLTANGTPILNFQWSTGQITEDVIGLCADTAFVTVTDGIGCQTIQQVVIAEPTQLIANSTVSNATCGLANGTATVTASGGIQPYQFLWSNGSTSTSITNLAPGFIGIVSVTDANNCVSSDTVQILNIAGPTSASLSKTDATCNSVCNGTATLNTISGGTAPYQLVWSTLEGTNTINGLCAGSYDVTITDANSCTYDTAFTINEPIAISATIATVNSTCNDSNGIAVVVPTGGSIPYTTVWSPSIGVQNLDSLKQIPAGTYTATVSDFNGCTSIFNAFVNNFNGPIVTIDNITDASCFGFANGAIQTTITGSNPFNLSWNNGATSDDIVGLTADQYILTAQDVLGCITVTPVIVDEPSKLLSNGQITNSTCGSCDGQISVSATGGSGSGYSYLWNNGATGLGLLNLCPSTYIVTITDGTGCSQADTLILNDIGGPTAVLANITDVSCFGLSNGAIGVQPVGGTQPYGYTWSTGAINVDTLSNLAAATYLLTVTDQTGCIFIETLPVVEPNEIDVIFVSVDATCGQADGSITATVTGGTAPYNLLWSNAATTASLSNIAAGSYNLTVSDALGCSSVNIGGVSNLNAPTITLDNLSDISCFGSANGSIDVTIAGNSPFTIQWTSPNGFTSPNEDISNLTAENYVLQVTDILGCITSVDFDINEPNQLTNNLFVTNATCGVCNGSIVSNVNGGTGTYNYSWNSGSNATSLTNLCPSLYEVTVTDANNCALITSAPLSNIGGPTNANINAVDLSCFESQNGSISLSPVGGTAPYNYTWNPSSSNTSSLVNLDAGDYDVTITDANSCLLIVPTITLSQPTEITASFVELNATCGATDGKVQAAVSGGAGGYAYQWLNANLVPLALATFPTAQTDSLVNIGSGIYNLSVTDAIGCSEVFNYNLSDLNAPVITLVSQTNVSCAGGSNGTLNVTITGTFPPFTNFWLPSGQTSEDISNLTPGTYTIQATDANGCKSFDSYTITEPSPIVASFDTTKATCGNSNGSIDAIVSGGSGILTSQWSTGTFGTTLSNVYAGVYSLQVTDGNGCQEVFNIGLSNSDGPTQAFVNVTNVVCFGQNNGNATVNAVGGTLPYSYVWTPGPITTANSLTNMTAGNYIVQVVDSNGCLLAENFTITSPDQLSDSVITQPATCGGNDGAVSVIITGGTAPYSFSPSQSITGLTDGDIGDITIVDALGCTQVYTYAISGINAAELTVAATDASCYGTCDGAATVTINGASPFAIQYLSGNGTILPGETNPTTSATLCAGEYIVQVTDQTTCTSFENFTITQPDSVSFGLPQVTNVSCFGLCDGIAQVAATGGILPYSYTWNDPNNQTSLAAAALCANTYTVVVKDANGCVYSQDITVNQPLILEVLSIVTTDALCAQAKDGAVNITLGGGSQPYNVTWIGPSGFSASTEDIDLIQAGTYFFQITDNGGCTVSDSAVVDNFVEISVIASNDTVICESAASAVIEAEGTGSGNLIYTWRQNGNVIGTGSSIAVSPGVNQATYIVTANDGVCFDTDTVKVLVEALPFADAGLDQQIIAGGSTELGGSPTAPAGVEFFWTPALGLNDSTISNPIASPTESGKYNLVVVSSNGCVAIDSCIITVVPRIVYSTGFTPNGDGVNDTWIIDFIDQYPNSVVEIYNRWGQKLFENKGYTTPFDGRYNGNDLPIGSYYFIINLNDPLVTDVYSGTITIMR